MTKKRVKTKRDQAERLRVLGSEKQIEAFLSSKPWATETREKYKRTIVALINEVNNIRPDEFTASDLSNWLNGKPWGESARYIALCSIRAFLRWQYGEHPAAKLKLPRGESGPQRSLNQEKVEKLFCTFDTTTPKGRRDLAMCTLFIDTGLRVSEMAGLQLDKVDLFDRMLSAITKGRIWENKSFSIYTASCVHSWLADRETIAKPETRTLFCGIGGTTPGKAMTRDGIKTVVAKWGKNAEIGKLSPHDFRRTFATLAVKNGAPTPIVMAQGGWRSEKVFLKYVRAIAPKDFEPYSPVMSIMDIPTDENR